MNTFLFAKFKYFKATHVFMSDKMVFIIVELDKFQKGLMKGVDTAIELWCQLIRDADGLK